MNNEQFDRQMNFILNQQAKFEVDIARLKEEQEKSAQNISLSAQNISLLEQNVSRLEQMTWKQLEIATNHEGRLTEAEDLITRLARVTNEGFKQLSVKIDALVDSQIRTDDVLQKFLRRSKNGRNDN